MLPADTIVACGSGFPGIDAPPKRALIRASGPNVFGHLASVIEWPSVPDCSAPPLPQTASFRFAQSAPHAVVRFSSARALPCLAMIFRGPHSYTGDDTIELITPGGTAITDRVLALLCAQRGVRLAQPGEFTARAFLAGKLTAEEAEGVAAIIAARTSEELTAADDLIAGRTGERYRAWSDELSTLLALVEAGIDFTDQEDVVPISPALLARRIDALLEAFDQHLGGAGSSEARSGEPAVVLAGQPNAGKSTLFNALLGRRRAIVSPIAGTTRDALAEPLDLSRDAPLVGTVHLVDLAGLETPGAALSGADQLAQQAATAALLRADVIIHCDPAGRFAPLAHANDSAVLLRVRTKADLPHLSAMHPVPDALAVCALDGFHLSALRRAIADAALAASGNGSGRLAIVPRHHLAIARARTQVFAARTALTPFVLHHALASPELIAGELRAGLDALGELTGAISPDDVIGRIFATFCVGK